MKVFTASPTHIAAALLTGVMSLSGCSGSGDSSPVTEAPDIADGSPVAADDEDVFEDDVPGVADPVTQNLIRIDFDIQVPAYQSDALQVSVTWGDTFLLADWVGDEFWAATDEFPAGTGNLMTVAFHDGNGEIILGSVEFLYETGVNVAETVRITADQFNTDRWDNDEDGISNLDELIAGTDPSGLIRVLLFSETQGFRHDSISDALLALEELASSVGIRADRTNDSSGVFTDEVLASYDAVVWSLTSGDVLDAQEQDAFERYIQAGGGYVGIHAASDTEYEWPWYGDLVGAYFERHPAIQTATQNVENNAHSSTTHLGATWTRTDEWYDYSRNPRTQVNVLLNLDESSYSGGGMGADHPSAWYHEYDGGRSWYTGGGHTAESYSEPDFRAHLLGGLQYAAGMKTSP